MKKNIVIVGSGIAGTLICNELNALNQAKVTLLECGEKNIIKYPKINFIKKALAKFRTFCNSGGGGSNLWHNGLIPINKNDVTSEIFSTILEESAPFINKAAQRLFFETDDYLNKYNAAVNDMQNTANTIDAFPDGVDCLIYPKKTSKLSPDEGIAEHYDVKNIEFISNGSKINRIDFTSHNQKHQIFCDILIICAGTFGTPQLVQKALSSIGSHNTTVGAGLIDHPAGFVGKVKFKRSINKIMRKFAIEEKDNYTYCTGTRIKSKCGNYTGFAFFRPALTMHNSLAIYQYKSLLAGSHGMARIKNALSIKLFHPDILLEVISHLFKIAIPTRTANILIYFQQRRSTNSVSYSNDTIDIDWQISEEEISIYNEILKSLKHNLAPISDAINIQLPITADWLRSGAHHSGTISIGDDINQGVLDRNLKLVASENVYVCDGSVIQEHSYANTGLTIGQLALRLAHKLALEIATTTK